MITHIRSKHRHSGRLSKWGALIGVELSQIEGEEWPRPTFLVVLPNMQYENWLVYSPEFEYEFRETEVSP